jgi:hypothetical protein
VLHCPKSIPNNSFWQRSSSSEGSVNWKPLYIHTDCDNNHTHYIIPVCTLFPHVNAKSLQTMMKVLGGSMS